MATTVCLTCLKSIGSDVPWLMIGKTQDAQKALSKHFWFAEDQCLKSIICLPCWHKIDEFHRFYCEVEQLHAQQLYSPIHLLEIKQEVNPLPFTPELEEELDRLDTDDIKAEPEHKETSDRRCDDDDVNDDDKVDNIDVDDDSDDDVDYDNDDDEFKLDNGSSEHEPSDVDDNDSGTKPKRLKLDKADKAKIRQYVKANMNLECTVCSKTTETFEDLQRHAMMQHETQAHVFCCDKKYTNLYRLNDHVMRHVSPESFKCQQCSKQCSSRDALRRHIAKVHTSDEEKKYQCKTCMKRFTKRRSLAMHEVIHARTGSKENKDTKKRHTSRKNRDLNSDKLIAENINLECDSCQKKFDTFISLQKHSREEHQKAAVVSCCGANFINKPRLYDHVRFHLDPTTFQCEICRKNLPHSESLKRHMDSNHTPEEAKTIQCSMCPKMFSHQKFLSVHERYHNRSWLCEICDRRFICEATLKAHIKEIHNRERNHVCHVCARTFHIYASYRSHLQTHGEIPKKVKPKEPVKCPVCGAMTLKLSNHMRLHSGARTCEICGQVCKNVLSYQYHMKNHEVGDFVCSICGKGFKKEVTLKEHLASHTGERLYSCDFCDRTFNSNANRMSHRKKMHPQQWLEDKLKKEAARRQSQQAMAAQTQ